MNQAQRQAFTRLTLIILTLTCVLSGLVLLTSNLGALEFAFLGTYFSLNDPEGTTGYDGQFVYFIARDGAEAVRYIDGPSLRYQRIILPVLARAVSLGQPEVVPWAILVINILAHSIGAGLVGALLAGWGQPALLGGLIYGLWIGSLLAVRLNLTEPLCMMLALAAILAYQRKRYRWAVLLLMLSTLTKEQGLFIAAGVALHALMQGHWRWASLLMGGPALLFGVWWGVMRLWLGELPTRYPAARELRLLPFNGLLAVKNPLELLMLTVWVAIPTVLLLGAALWMIWRHRHVLATLPLSVWLVLPAAGFVMLMPAGSWGDQVAAYRVALPIVLAGVLFIGQVMTRWMPWLALAWLTPNVLLLLLVDLWIVQR